MRRRNDRRSEHRLSFQGVIRGRLRRETDELRFEAFDISRRGIGLYMSPCPEEGEEVSLDLKASRGATLRFRVKHIYDDAKEGMRRCGIELEDKDSGSIDLVELISRYTE